MILIDTSVWIENFKKNPKITIPKEMVSEISVCPPVIQEVLQGIKDDIAEAKVRSALLSFRQVGEKLDERHFLKAAEIYRSGRKRGITIRSSVDCLIAAIALGEKIAVWHRDRDFDEIARFTDLQVWHPRG